MTLFDWIIPIRLVDLIEVCLVAYLLYRLYLFMRGTIAVGIFLGILALFLLRLLVDLMDMTILSALFSSLSGVAVLAVIVLFQPEIRRVLLLVGQNPFVRRFISNTAHEDLINEVVGAVDEMSTRNIGALLVFERSAGLRNYIETGENLQALVSRDLLITIFYSQNPLHDGALIIRNRRIEAARCILPVSTSMKLSPLLGLRHRAAVGITEQTDAFVIVVSEETGNISVAENGMLTSNISVETLRNRLTKALTMQSAPMPAAELAPAER